MAKSKPVGVRFNEDLLNKLIQSGVVTSPQKALILYESAFLQNQTVADYFHKPTLQNAINFEGLKGRNTSVKLNEEIETESKSNLNRMIEENRKKYLKQ